MNALCIGLFYHNMLLISWLYTSIFMLKTKAKMIKPLFQFGFTEMFMIPQ